MFSCFFCSFVRLPLQLATHQANEGTKETGKHSKPIHTVNQGFTDGQIHLFSMLAELEEKAELARKLGSDSRCHILASRSQLNRSNRSPAGDALIFSGRALGFGFLGCRRRGCAPPW